MLASGSAQTSGRYFGFRLEFSDPMFTAGVTYQPSDSEQAILFSDPGSLSVDQLLTGGATVARDYSIQAATLQRVRTGAVVVDFEGIESLGVATGGGSGVLTLRDAQGTDVTTTSIDAGGGIDDVNIFDLSANTIIDLGDGADSATIETTASGTLTINAGAGDDFLDLVDVGANTSTTLNGDDGNDFFRVEGDNLESTTNTTIAGGSPNIPNPGDELLFDPNGQSFTIYDGAGNPTGTTTTPGGGLQVNNRGLVDYGEIENVQIEGAPIITFDPAQLTIAEGDTLNLDVAIDFAGQAQIGDIEWDLDNDGVFAEPEELSGASQVLTWEQLLISSGIRDDGLYTIAVRATNSVATTTRYRTLTVTNTPPTITPPTESTGSHRRAVFACHLLLPIRATTW